MSTLDSGKNDRRSIDDNSLDNNKGFN
jgi:hypothetical protein